MDQPNWWEVGQTLMRSARGYRDEVRLSESSERISSLMTTADVLDVIGAAICAHTPKPY